MAEMLSLTLAFFAGGMASSFTLYMLVIKKMKDRYEGTVHVSDKHQLEVSYLKGKQDGFDAAMKRFAVKYEGYVEESSNFLSKQSEAGYYVQLTIDGLPILEKTKVVISNVKESKDSNIEKLIGEVSHAVVKAAEAFSGFGVSAIAEKQVKRLIKK